jgi:microcystin-dependent protein
MPVGSRVRANNVFGVTTDNPLTAGATTLNSTQLALLPAITSPTQHAVIVLDPKRVNGQPEIIVVTAHVALATSATIERAKYGTIARSHPVGSAWAHVAIGEDYIEILTSTSRPSDPYIGQSIFETDTLSHRFYNGSSWNSSPPIGALLPYLGSVAPVGYLFADGTAVSRTGVTADLFAVIGTTYGAGNGVTTFNLPNLNGRVPVGRNPADLEFDVLGETGGEKAVALDATKLPQHLHGIQDQQHLHGETPHNHNLNVTNGNHGHGFTINGGGGHDHQSTGPGNPVMVIQTGAGPFNVSAPGTDFVTFDVGHTARTSSVGDHGHGSSINASGNIMQPVVSNQLLQATGIVTTQNTGVVNPTHNNLQPYITVNYIVKI